MVNDILDAAHETEELFRDAALSRRQKEAPKAGGICLNCEEKIAPNRRWCDADCRDDWEKWNV